MMIFNVGWDGGLNFRILTRMSLHITDKHQYLVQSMVPGSRAEKLVLSYPQIPENYPKIIAALQDRFGDQVLLTEVYVRKLLKIVIANASQSNEMCQL